MNFNDMIKSSICDILEGCDVFTVTDISSDQLHVFVFGFDEFIENSRPRLEEEFGYLNIKLHVNPSVVRKSGYSLRVESSGEVYVLTSSRKESGNIILHRTYDTAVDDLINFVS